MSAMKIVPADDTIADLKKKAPNTKSRPRNNAKLLLPYSEKKQGCAVSG
jgi:hypothetical protein